MGEQKKTMMGCKRRSISSFQKVTVWVVVITLLWENITLGQPVASPKLFNPSIPYHIGSIKDVWLSPDNKSPVYIIQDSHANLIAQKNIIKILQLLRGTHIGIEGAKGVVDTNLIRAIPNDDNRRYIADNLLEKGELTGAEYYAGILDDKVKLYGIEEPGLYFKNLRQFRKAVKDKKRLQPYLAKWRERLEVQSTLLNKEQRQFLDKYISFHEGRISLSGYISYLPVSARETNLNLYKTCLNLEEGLGLDKVDREHRRLLEVLGEQDASIQFRLGRISPLEYYSFLDSLEWPRDEYPELFRYIQLIQLQARIDKDGLERELRIVEEDRGQIIQGWKDFIYVNKLVDLRLSPDEVRPGNSKASVFYKTALKRDRVLLKNFLRFVYSGKKPSVLITGGFHSEGIAKRLRQRGIPYVIISPKMASEGRNAYQDLLFNHKDELDRILSHTGRRLAPILRLPHEMALPQQIRILQEKVGIMQIVLEITANPYIDRLRQLQDRMQSAVGDEKDRLQRQLVRVIQRIDEELHEYMERFIANYIEGKPEIEKERIHILFREKLKVNLEDLTFHEGKVIIHVNIEGLDIYISSEEEAKRGKTFRDLLAEKLGPFLVKIEPGPGFTWRKGKGSLSNTGQAYFIRGSQFVEEIFSAGRFQYLDGLVFRSGENLIEVNLEERKAEINTILVAILQWIVDKDGKKDRVEAFYRFLLHHEDLHGKWRELGPAASEFMVQQESLSNTSPTDLITIRDLINYILDKKGNIEKDLGEDIFQAEDLLAFRDLLNLYIGLKLYNRISRSEFLLRLREYIRRIFPKEGKELPGQPLGISSELGDFQERLSDYNGLDYVVISDNPGGVAHRDGLEVIKEIRERFNFILTIATKPRSLEEIRKRILEGYEIGVKNFLIVSGDLPGEGSDSIQAIQYLKADRALPKDIRLGAVENPFSGPSLHERVNRLEKKILAGADFIITQPVFDLDRFRAWMKRVRDRGLHRLVPIWAGFMPVRDQGLLKRLVQKLGLHLPAMWFSRDMQENYREILEGLVREEGLSGIHIMPLKGSRRLAGYSEVIRKHPAQSVIGRFDLERARRLNRIEELGFEQVNKLRIEGDSVLYKRDGGLPSYPVVLLKAPLNSKPAIDALVGLLEKLDLDRFNLRIYLYKEEAPIPAPHHPGLASGQKGEGASSYVLDFKIYDYEGENISSGFRDYLNELQLEINYKMPWRYKALLGIFWFFSIERLLKIPFLGCIKCGQCVLTTTAFICIMRHCAKQMRNGPCGDLLPDGKCRLGGECAWHKIHERLKRWKRYSQWLEKRGLYWLANFLDREPLLRQILAPWDKRLSGTSSQLNALRGIIKGIEFAGRQRATLRVEIPESRGLARDIRRAFRQGGYLSVLDAIDKSHHSKERIIADIKTWEERLKERKKDLSFREKAHMEIEGLVYKFYSFVDKDDFKPLAEIFRGVEVPSGEKIWHALRRITPIEVLDGVTGVIGEMPIGVHLRETVENINRLVRFSEEDRVHFKDLQPEYLSKLKESMDAIWQNKEDRVILYLASILHDYGMFLRNYGTNSHAVDGERMINPLIDRLVQEGIITQEQGEIILALIGGHVLIRVALGYIPPNSVYRSLIDPVVQERFLRCLRIMYLSDCSATPLFQSVGLINEMARRTIKYTDRETISNLDRLRLLSGGKDISADEPWLAEFLDKATFDMPTEILVFTQLEPEILIKFLYYLNELRRHFDTAPDFLFVVNNDSSGRITSILSHLDFQHINHSLFPAYLDKNRKQIVVQIKEEVDEDRRRLLGLGLALIAVPSLFLPGCRALCAQPKLSNLGMITNWIRRNSNSITRLPASHPDSPRHINWGLLYDHSIASIMLALANDKEGAHRILDFYNRRYSVPIEELNARKDRNNVVGIIRILPDLHGRPMKGIINGVDISNSSRDGYGTEWYVDSGPQAWLGIALLQVDSKRYISFAKEIGDFILRLQDTDGAIVAGPRSQKTNEREQDRSQLKHTEHNLSCYGFLRMLYEVTKDNRYRGAAERIKGWLLNTAYRKDGGYFIQGIHNGIPNERFASDVQAWAVLALGVNGLGFARAERVLKVLKEKAVVQVGDIKGLDFTDPRDPTVTNERGGYRPMISPEWTAGLIMAYYEMGGIYRAKADRLYNDIWRLAKRDGDRIAFPYATLKGVPTGHGWNTPNGSQSLAGVWMGFVEKRFNPFRLRRTRPGSPETANKVIKKHFLDGAWFMLEEYLAMLDLEYSHSVSGRHVIAKVTARRDLEKLARRGWVEIDKSRRPYRYRVSEKPLEREEDEIRRLEKRLRELPNGKSITFIFDMDGTLVTSEGERRAVSYGIPQIFKLLKQYGHKVGILTDASMSYTLFILRQLGVDLGTIDYLMPVYELIGRRLAKDIAEAYGLQDVHSSEDLRNRLRGLGIRIITHSQFEKVKAFKKMVAMSNPESVVICDDKEEVLEKIQQDKGTVRNFIGINCKEEFSSLANNLNNALWFIDQDVASSIVRVVGYKPDYVSPALYRELLPKARIEIREDEEDPLAEYLLGAGRKTDIFWGKLWDWLWDRLDVRQLKIIDASTLVNNSSSDTAIVFKRFILTWLYKVAQGRKWFNLNFAIVNIDPGITREDILNTLGLEEKYLGEHLRILDLSKDKAPLKWDGDVTTAYLDTPEHRDFFSQIEGARLIPVTPPGEGGFISGSGVLASVLMDRPGFIDTMPEPMREELKGLLVTAEGRLRVPAFRYSESHLPIERDGEGYSDRGELLVKPTPVLEIDRGQLEKLGLPDTGELLKAIRKVISFYQIYGERDVPDYWIDIRKGLKRPLEIRGRTITIDIDLLKVPSDYLFPFLLHLAGHEGGHSLFTADHLHEREEEAIVLFIDALRFSRHTRRVQDAIIGAFRSLKGLVDTRYIEFLESLRKDPRQDLAELIKNTLGIDTRYLEMRIFKNGEPPAEISGIDELFSSFKYQKVKWSLVVTRKEYYGQVRIRKKVVLFDEKGHLITNEGGNGIEFQYGLGLNSLFRCYLSLKPRHQGHGLGEELAEKIEVCARLNAFGEEYQMATLEFIPLGELKPQKRQFDINRSYFALAQRIVPLIIPHIDPDAVSQNLPKEGPWDGKKYTHAELLYFVAQDKSGSVASVILDAILSRIGLEPLLGLPDIDITPSEKILLQTRLKQLNLDEKNQVLNDILDTIYLRSQRFVDYIPRANAVIRLEDFKERLSQYYLLVDIARLDDALAKKLIELRKQGRIARIIWSSYDIADEELIRDRLDEFEEGLYNIRDIIIPNQATDYTDYIKGVLRKNRIPMDRLIVIATEESYDAVYRHIGEVLRDVKLSLTAKEFNFLIPHLPGDIVDRFKQADGRYLLELDPLEEDPRGCIEGLEEAQRELAKAA